MVASTHELLSTSRGQGEYLQFRNELMQVSKIIKAESLHIQAYHLIKESIMNGKLKPEDRIVEARTAKELGVSRGTVREAVRMLIQDGLLLYNDGLVKVYNPSRKDIVDIFECRESLEVLAIRLALKNLDEDTLRRLAQNIEETKKLDSSSSGLGTYDQEFHTIIIESSNNNHLIKLLEAIKVKLHYMRNCMVGEPFYTSFIEEHQRIYDALADRDAERAETLMSEHVQKALKGVLMHIEA